MPTTPANALLSLQDAPKNVLQSSWIALTNLKAKRLTSSTKEAGLMCKRTFPPTSSSAFLDVSSRLLSAVSAVSTLAQLALELLSYALIFR